MKNPSVWTLLFIITSISFLGSVLGGKEAGQICFFTGSFILVLFLALRVDELERRIHDLNEELDR